MGAGSSKEEAKKPAARDTKTEKAVANVNNHGSPATNSKQQQQQQQQQPNQRTFITQDDRDEDARFGNQTGARSQRDATSSDRHAEQTTTRETWRLEPDPQDELNEVLQIPSDHRQQSRPVHTVNPVRQEDLPETYAQRKQREQYTLNQQMLLRQKTIYRNPDEWTDDETTADSGGFDPSKFRSVNHRQVGQSNIFSTKGSQEGQVSYTSGRNDMDEFDVAPRKPQSQQLPVYNASEQDLMASLERELM